MAGSSQPVPAPIPISAGPGAGTSSGTTWYTVPAAADRLGLTERAVRKRIAAGTIMAERTAAGWRVALPTEPGPEPGPPSAGPVPEPGPEPAVLAALQSEVAFLRSELQAQRERHAREVEAWQERLREAHLLAAQQRALPAPDATEATAPGPEPPPRPWWRWWRRH